MGTIYQAILFDHRRCFEVWAKEGSDDFNCVAITSDDELICTNCGEIITV